MRNVYSFFGLKSLETLTQLPPQTTFSLKTGPDLAEDSTLHRPRPLLSTENEEGLEERFS